MKENIDAEIDVNNSKNSLPPVQLVKKKVQIKALTKAPTPRALSTFELSQPIKNDASHDMQKSPSLTKIHKIKLGESTANKSIYRSYIKPFTITTQLQSHNKKGIFHVEQELRTLEGKYEKLLANYDETFDTLPLEKRAYQLRQDNKEFRNELKRLNDLITEIVESKKNTLKKQLKTINEPREDISSKEIKNAEKQLQNAEFEYQVMASRMEQISQPQYMEELKEKNITLTHRIKRMERSKKSMEVEQSHREKKMGKVIDNGESDIVQEIHRITAEIGNINKQITEADDILDRRSKALHDHSARLENAKAEWKKADNDGQSLGVELNVLIKKTNKEKFLELEEKKETMLKQINLLKSRNTYSLSDYMQKKNVLQKTLTNTAQALQTKNEMWLNKKEELANLVLTMKNSCTNAVEALNKKIENQQNIKEKNKQKNVEKTAEDIEEEIKKADLAIKVKELVSAMKIQFLWKKYKKGKDLNKNNLDQKDKLMEPPKDEKKKEQDTNQISSTQSGVVAPSTETKTKANI